MEDMTPQQAINRERNYQKKKWGSLDLHNSTGDFIVYMQRYLAEAIKANHPLNPEDTMTKIRKVTALGVTAMKKFGVGKFEHEIDHPTGIGEGDIE